MTIPTVLLVLPLLLAFCWVWAVLATKALKWVEPHFLRWFWHWLGGEGEPPH